MLEVELLNRSNKTNKVDLNSYRLPPLLVYARKLFVWDYIGAERKRLASE